MPCQKNAAAFRSSVKANTEAFSGGTFTDRIGGFLGLRKHHHQAHLTSPSLNGYPLGNYEERKLPISSLVQE